jgi:hypothetical protein
MKHAVIQNNVLVAHGNLQQLFPSTSFPVNGPSQDWLNDNNVQQIVDELPFNKETEKLEFVEPYVKEGKVFSAKVAPLSSEELSLNEENTLREKVNAQRQHRNRLLNLSDYKMLKDNFDNMALNQQQAWIDYRQLLRDLPQQSEFNSGNATFPEPPSPLSPNN